MKVAATLILLLCTLGGCGKLLLSSIVPARPETARFTLEAPECRGEQKIEGPSIFLSDIQSSSFIDSTRIVFSEAPNTRAAYTSAEWVESPPRALENILVRRMQCAGLFRSVERRTSMVRTDYQLTVHLNDFFYNAIRSPGYVQIEGTAELIDLKTRRAVARRDLNINEEVAAVDIQSAVQAFQRASSTLGDELNSWLGEVMMSDHSRT